MTLPSKGVGKFIVFEGAHASGKTTAARLAVRELRNIGIPAIYTKEPFSTRLRPVIQELSKTRSAKPVALAFLIAADRSLHLDRILEWVRQGKYVICDRYKLSSLVYQRIDGLSPAAIRRINNAFREPDSIFLFVAPLELRLERLDREKRDSRHRFLSREALEREQKFYSSYARTKLPGLTVLDGSLEPKVIVNHVLQVIEKGS